MKSNITKMYIIFNKSQIEINNTIFYRFDINLKQINTNIIDI